MNENILHQENSNGIILNQGNGNEISHNKKLAKIICSILLFILIIVELILILQAESDYDKEKDKLVWTKEEEDREDNSDYKGFFDYLFLIPISIIFSILISCSICTNSFRILTIIVCIIFFGIKELILLSRLMDCYDNSRIKERLDCPEIFHDKKIWISIIYVISQIIAISYQVFLLKTRE